MPVLPVRGMTYLFYNITTDSSKLRDEPRLKYRKISIIDGNTSLRRVNRHGSANTQIFHSDYFLPADVVNGIEVPSASHQVCYALSPLMI